MLRDCSMLEELDNCKKLRSCLPLEEPIEGMIHTDLSCLQRQKAGEVLPLINDATKRHWVGSKKRYFCIPACAGNTDNCKIRQSVGLLESNAERWDSFVSILYRQLQDKTNCRTIGDRCRKTGHLCTAAYACSADSCHNPIVMNQGSKAVFN